MLGFGCKKCHYTGRLGFLNGDKNQPIRCKCTLKPINGTYSVVKGKLVRVPIKPTSDLVEKINTGDLIEHVDPVNSEIKDK